MGESGIVDPIVFSEDKGWSDTLGSLIRDVANRLGARESSGERVLEAVYHAALDLLRRRPDGFFLVTEHATLGAAYDVSLTFLADQFRRDLTAAAHKRLGHR